MSEQPAKRRGRPPLAPADRKDGNMTFRTRGDLRQRLAEEARKNGRTISEEVEWRLERSLDGLSGEDTESAQYYSNLRMILGSEADLTEAVELGIHWNRFKDSFKAMHDSELDWYENRELTNKIEDDFKGGIRRLILAFAGRRQREASQD